MYKRNVGRKEFTQFPNLSMNQKSDEDVITYCQHLEALNFDFNKLFEDILKICIPEWVLDLFASMKIKDCLK